MFALLLSTALTLQAEELSAATKKASDMPSYTFKIDTKGDGKGVKAAPAVEGRYEKDKAQSLKINGTDTFRKAGLVVVKDGEAWKRLEKPPKGEKPARGSLTIQSFGGIKLPHEELADFEKAFEKIEKTADGELVLYSGALTPEGARTAGSTGSKAEGKSTLTYSGAGKVWVNKDGVIVKYEIAVKAKGTVREKEVEQSHIRTVQLSDVGATKVEVPEGAAKLLEGRS